jgi:peptide-methionine (S)-S-oxide reductase
MLLGSRCNVQGQESDMNDATSNDAARAGDAGDGKPEAKAQGDDKQPRKASAIFAAGCFWGVEHKFQNTEGVLDAVSGYVGGTKDNPTYRQVCTGRTGHAEAVRVTYDPAKISYDELLETFWNLHDPTQVNRQGPDFGTQYRSAIFYLNEEQKKTAEASRKALESSGRYNRPIATEITEAGTFWPAEEYHQDYIAKKGGQVCH